MSIKLIIEDLISQNAKDFEVAKAIKADLNEYFQNLGEIFQTTGGRDFTYKHTAKIDEVLSLMYKYILRKNFGSYIPMSSSIPFALVALGSYGREQLSVYSDIDLMIVYKDVEGYNLKPMMEQMLYLAWDAGLKLGHRVHEVGELFNVSREDITIKTSLIEARLIIGSKILWYEVEQKLINIREDGREKFISDKIAELHERHKKQPLTMSFQLKEAQGGLRDSHTLFWILNAMYNVQDLKDMIGKLYDENEHKEYRTAIEFLNRVRNGLHIISKKKNDKLEPEILPDLIELLDMTSTSTLSNQMFLSQKIITYAHDIYRYTMMFLSRLEKRDVEFSLKEFFSTNQTEIDFCKIDQLNMLEINKKSISNIKAIFHEENLSNKIYMLYYANQLGNVVNPLKKVLYLPQFDGYHKSPVGIHSIDTLVRLESIDVENIKNIFESFTKEQKALLRLVALIHDGGKGRVKDHSLVGEQLFKVYAKQIGFSEEMIELGGKLIRYHVLMSTTVKASDIYSQKVILDFTSKLIDVLSIKMLYVLTYADISAVDKKYFTSQTRFLLHELYIASIDATNEKDVNKESSRKNRKIEAIKKDKKYLDLDGKLKKKIISIDSNLLYLKLKKDDIINLSIKANSVENFSYEIVNKEVLTIKIIRKHELNLGYLLGKLSFLGIRDMSIFKLFDGLKYFQIEFSKPIDKDDMSFVEGIIETSFDMSRTIELEKPIIKKDEIIINCDHTNTLASFAINAKDQYGLFAYVAKTLDDFKIDIESAKIFTQRNRVQDLLLIEKNGNFCDSLDSIKKAILTV